MTTSSETMVWCGDRVPQETYSVMFMHSASDLLCILVVPQQWLSLALCGTLADIDQSESTARSATPTSSLGAAMVVGGCTAGGAFSGMMLSQGLRLHIMMRALMIQTKLQRACIVCGAGLI